MSEKDFSFALVFAFFGGGVATLFLLVLLYVVFTASPIDLLQKYQPLISAMIASAAALLALSSARRQMAQSQRLEIERRQRKAYAERATMPIALTGVVQYCEQCLRLLSGAPRLTSGSTIPDALDWTWMPSAMPEFPGQDLEILGAHLESADEARNAIADLLMYAQIQHSRLSDMVMRQSRAPDLEPGPLEIGTYFVDTLELHERASRLYEYARRESNDVDSYLSDERLVQRACHYVAIDDEDNELIRAIRRRCDLRNSKP